MIESLIALAFLLPATAAALYYFTFVMLSRFTVKTSPRPAPTTQFTVLVPAHNEALSLPRTLQSIQRCDYPRELLDIAVIADNCDDDTADVARRHGVRVLQREVSFRRGKGYALEFGFQEILKSKPDAVLILDADSEFAPDALRLIDARFAGGACVVQGSIRTHNAADSATALVATVGNVLDNAVAAGRDSLGLPVSLRGLNMAFRRGVLEEIPWTCFGLTEDAEYTAKLHAAGIRIAFEPRAIALSESPARLEVLSQQRRRWRAALRNAGPLAWLDSKPTVLAHLSLTTLVVIVAAAMLAKPMSTILAVWLMAIWLMTIAVYGSALVAIGTTKSLMGIPRVVLRLLTVTLSGFHRRETHWQRTRRIAEG